MVGLYVDTSLIPADSNVRINKNNGLFEQGKAFTLEKKLKVATTYKMHSAMVGGKRPNLAAVAREAGVSRKVVRKIEAEIETNGRILRPSPPNSSDKRKRGVGSYSLKKADVEVLLALMEENPFQTRRSYCVRLRKITGTVISESTVTNFFLKGFSIKGSLRKPNHIPRDKFKPENVERYFQYVDFVQQVGDRRRLKFGDEKLLKGSEVYCKKGRRNVITGEMPEQIVNSDFRNTYAIIGFCGIDPDTPAVSFSIHDEKNNAASFSDAVINALAEGFLRPWDILVLDNAAIHFKGENQGLIDYMWDYHRIAIVPLPTRSPELNPQELVWRSLTMKLRAILVSSGAHACAVAATNILKNMTHSSIESTYRECGYIA